MRVESIPAAHREQIQQLSGRKCSNNDLYSQIIKLPEQKLFEW